MSARSETLEEVDPEGRAWLASYLDVFAKKHAHELAEKQRAAIEKTDDPVFYRGEAGWLPDLIDPEKSCTSGCSCVCHTADTSPCDDCSGVLNSGN